MTLADKIDAVRALLPPGIWCVEYVPSEDEIVCDPETVTEYTGGVVISADREVNGRTEQMSVSLAANTPMADVARVVTRFVAEWKVTR